MSSLVRFVRSPIVVGALVAAWAVATCNIVFFRKFAEALPEATPHRMLLIVLTGLVLFLIYNIVLQLLFWGRWTKFVPILLVVLAAVAGYASLVFGVGVDGDQIHNVLETNSREASGFLNWQGAFWLTAMIAPPVALVLWARPAHRIGSAAAIKAGVVALSLVAGLAIVAVNYIDYAATFRAHRYLRDYIAPANVFAGLHSFYRKAQPLEKIVIAPYGEDARRVNPTARPRLLVFVLGETARAESFSLGGYARMTNPKLAREDVIYFPNTSSCGTATNVSVPCIFSGMTREEYSAKTARARESLLDVARRAGYETAWLDNNTGCKGTCVRGRELTFSPDIVKTWCEGRDFCLDEAMVEEMQRFLKDEPTKDRVIVLHQVGSHGPSYFKRYPENIAGRFDPVCATSALQTCSYEAIVNTYDNSILYTDLVLARVIDVLKKEDRYDSSMIYASDHGESTGEKGLYLHGAPYMLAPSQQTHVPMLIWLSDAMKKAAPVAAGCIAAHRDAKVSHDNIFPTVLGLLDVETRVRRANLDLTRCD